MTVFDLLRNSLLFGVGVQEKMKGFIYEMVKQGELSESQGAKVVKGWVEEADKSAADLEKQVVQFVAETLKKMNIPSEKNVEDLRREVAELSARVEKLEAGR